MEEERLEHKMLFVSIDLKFCEKEQRKRNKTYQSVVFKLCQLSGKKGVKQLRQTQNNSQQQSCQYFAVDWNFSD